MALVSSSSSCSSWRRAPASAAAALLLLCLHLLALAPPATGAYTGSYSTGAAATARVIRGIALHADAQHIGGGGRYAPGARRRLFNILEDAVTVAPLSGTALLFPKSRLTERGKETLPV
jgi:hypothetical protein